jgi:hypothetical protein
MKRMRRTIGMEKEMEIQTEVAESEVEDFLLKKILDKKISGKKH